MVSLLIGSLDKIEKISPIIQKEHLALVIVSVSFIVCLIIVETFGSRQKSIVLAKRKIITLRRMLGLNYGSQEFLFPKGGVEGSSSPFEIQLKLDWRLFIIPILFSITCFILKFSYIGMLCAISILIYRYIKTIQDINENFSFILFRSVFQIFGLKFVANMEEVLYRAKLSAMECRRQKNRNRVPKGFCDPY